MVDERNDTYRGKLPSNRLAELLAEVKAEVTEPAAIATELLHQALLALPELKLPGGMTAKIESFFSPHADSEGRMHCGIDLRLSNGNLLEFTLKNTGWEKSHIANLLKQTDREGPQR
jgi:hypothetical protein